MFCTCSILCSLIPRNIESYTWQSRISCLSNIWGIWWRLSCLRERSLIYRFIKYGGIPVYIFNSFAFVCWKVESILNANLIKKVLPHFTKSFNKTTKEHKIAFIKFWCYFMILNSFDLNMKQILHLKLSNLSNGCYVNLSIIMDLLKSTFYEEQSGVSWVQSYSLLRWDHSRCYSV